MSTDAPFLSKGRNVFFVALLYTFLWGCAFPLVKLCMQSFEIAEGDEASKCLVAGIRFFLSGGAILLVRGRKAHREAPIPPKKIPLLLGYGLLATAAQYAFTYIGLSRVDGAKGAVYDQCCVFLIVLAGGIFFRDDPIDFCKIEGVIVGFIGIFLTSVDFSDPVAFHFSFSLLGEGMMLLAALCQTAAYFLAKASAATVRAELLVGWGQLSGGGLLIVGALLAGGRLTVFPLSGIIYLILLAGISAVAYVLSLLPLRYAKASALASYNLLIPVFGVLSSAVILGERPNVIQYVAALALIALSIRLVHHEKAKKGSQTSGER